MRIDLHCPVELTDHELLHDDRGKVRAYLKCFNLSSQRVTHLEAVVHLLDEQGGEEVQSLSQDVDAGPRKPFTLTVKVDPVALSAVNGLWMAFTKLSFESGQPDWIGHPGRLVDIPDMPMPDGRELNKLMAVAGRDAVCFPRRAGTYWVCVCGRPNAYRRKTCARCGRQRDLVLTHCDMAQVLRRQPILTPAGDHIELPLMQAAPPSPPAKDTGLQTLRRKFLRQRSLLIRRTLTMLVIAALIALAAWLAAALQQETQPPESIPPVKMHDSPAV